MKTLLKAAALTAALGFSVSAMADDASEVFKWIGTVDKAPVSGATKIINAGTVPFLGAKVLFQADDAGDVTIVDAEKLVFAVMEDDQGVDKPAVSFDYQLTAMSYQSGGFSEQVDPTNPEFIISVGGTALERNVPVTGASGDITLELSTPAPLTNVLVVGESAVITAEILVQNSTL
ncbi:hypothetical protein V4T45_003994 [Vibrio vulnificus]|nr:hypothetical protein [Vibrio vulnificus]ELR8772625.1 hypothetical protein [Vibrio vulnificus]